MQNLNELQLNEVKDSQLPALEILVNLGWTYISKKEVNEERKNDNSKFILANIAKEKLMEINSYEVDNVDYKFSDKDIYDAIEEIERVPFDGMTSTSEKIFNTIMPTSGGRTVKVNVNGKNSSQNFKFIDFTNIERNSFHVAVEYTVSGKQDVRPDIVCFVNGLPFVVIENKRGSVPINEAISDLIKKQSIDFAPRFFAMTQLLIAANGNEVQYGATGTPAKFYAVWKEKSESQNEFDIKIKNTISKKIDENIYNQILIDLNENKNSDLQSLSQDLNRMPTPQDKSLFALLVPSRLLDLTKNYILFDAGVKKISRYQQYFAIDKMLKRIEEREVISGNNKRKGGIVWHTQGSGKSLTMVMFVKAIIESQKIINPRVIIVTDRKDLDRQIRDTFKSCNLKKEVTQATSGQHLIDLIKNKTLNVVTTLVFKFDSLSKNISDFSDTDENIFVLIDEAHRSQNGMANLQMNKIIPNACYIAFTGTPLMKDEKATYKKFGDYIDKYTIDDALTDGVVLPLIYEGKFVNAVANNEMIDKHVERLAENLSDKDKKILHKDVNKKTVKNNPQVISEIAYDIEKHFSLNFQGTGLKAQLVAPSKYSAILFQKFFERNNKIKTATVISDESFEIISDEDDHKKEVLEFLTNIKNTKGNIEKYEKDVIDSFKNNEDGVEIIIVVDKLLTGFDAPRNTILYLCKDLKDHNLLQAIARVNRLFENKKLPKTAGYIIDYSENAKNIDSAMKLFGNYDEDDVKNTLIDIKNKVAELSESHANVIDIFKVVKNKNDVENYLTLLSSEFERNKFYKNLNTFVRNMSECFALQEFVHEFKGLENLRVDLKKFLDLRKIANIRYADKTDLTQYKKALIRILDKYIDAEEVELLTKPIDITNKEEFQNAIASLGDKTKAEAIAFQLDKTISEKYDTDPSFYEKFSFRVTEVIENLRKGKLADIEALKQLKLWQEDLFNKKDETISPRLTNIKCGDVYYRNIKEFLPEINEEVFVELVLNVSKIVENGAIVDWYKNNDVKRVIMNNIDDYLYDFLSKNNIHSEESNLKNLILKILDLSEKNYEIFN